MCVEYHLNNKENMVWRITAEEVDGAIVEAHDLAREAEADAGAVGFGGEKGYE